MMKMITIIIAINATNPTESPTINFVLPLLLLSFDFVSSGVWIGIYSGVCIGVCIGISIGVMYNYTSGIRELKPHIAEKLDQYLLEKGY